MSTREEIEPRIPCAECDGLGYQRQFVSAPWQVGKKMDCPACDEGWVTVSYEDAFDYHITIFRKLRESFHHFYKSNPYLAKQSFDGAKAALRLAHKFSDLNEAECAEWLKNNLTIPNTSEAA